MQAFLNPIQFHSAATAAGIDALEARKLYGEALAALRALSPLDFDKRAQPRPLEPRKLPASARGNLRIAIEEQNAERAAAVEVAVLPNVYLSFCAGVVADVRIT